MTVRTAVGAAARHSLLRRLLVHALAIGGALAATELLVPGRLGEATGSLTSGTTAYGLLAAAGFGLAAAVMIGVCLVIAGAVMLRR